MQFQARFWQLKQALVPQVRASQICRSILQALAQFQGP